MPVEFQDYYQTLGVSRDASDDELKKAFRKLARKHHPDVAEDKAGAEAKFKEINEAYEVLSDPDKRKKYDRLGADWQNGGGFQPPPGWGAQGGGYGGGSQEYHFGGTGFSDFFEQFFGGGGGYGHPGGYSQGGMGGGVRSRRGGDIEGDLMVTLDEAMHGTERSISLQSSDPRTGETKTQTLKVRIPAGAIDGSRIRVKGQGQTGIGSGESGDLMLRIRHAAHPDFSTKEEDVYFELGVAPWEAVLGAEVVVHTLDGDIKLRIAAGAENGQKMRVRGRGLPKGKSGERGDFYVVVDLRLPTELSTEERALWEKLRETSTFRPR